MFGEKPSDRVRLPIFKVKGGSNAFFVVRARDVVGFMLHWLGSRSYVCPGSECAACEQHVGAKWRGLLAVARLAGSAGDWRGGLLEITDNAYGRLRFVQALEGFDDFLGLRVVASRRSNKSPLAFEEASCGQSERPESKEVREEVVRAALATLYGLPSPGPGETLAAYEERASSAARIMIVRVMSRMAFADA